MNETVVRILAFDPGGTTGWALLEGCSPVRMGEIKKDLTKEVHKLLIETEPDVIIIEDFITRPEWGNSWKKTDTPKKIGDIRTLCDLADIPWHMQQPAIKPVGYGMAGLKYVKGKKGTHMQDAIAHGVYYYRKVIEPGGTWKSTPSSSTKTQPTRDKPGRVIPELTDRPASGSILKELPGLR